MEGKRHKETFATRLDSAIERDGRQRQVIAAEIGVDPGRLSKWTREKKPEPPGLTYLQKISRAMPWLSMEWLITGRGEPSWRPASGDVAQALRDLLVILASNPMKEAESRGTAVRMILDFLQAGSSEGETPQ